MIEDYVKASRRSHPAAPRFFALYEAHYRNLCLQAPPSWSKPRLFVTYSVERRCEFVRLGGEGFLIYDQHLGQSFNKLNKIQFASNGSSLSRAYACKYMAQRLLSLGASDIACFLAAASAASRSKHDALSPGQAELRGNLILVQEPFVMAHEFVHALTCLDREWTNSMKGYIEERVASFIDSHRKHDSIVANQDEAPGGSTADYYHTIFVNNRAELLSELLADDYGATLTYLIARAVHGVESGIVREAIILAFKYTRLFRHLDLVVRGLSQISNIRDAERFAGVLQSIGHDLWDGEATGARIRVLQFREHFLRYQLRVLEQTVTGTNSAGYGLIENYDEVTEFPVLTTLVDTLAEVLDPSVLASIRGKFSTAGAAAEAVDQLTGWTRVGDEAVLRQVAALRSSGQP